MESHYVQTPDPLVIDPDVTIAISVLSLFGFAALLCLAILTVVLIRKRRFGVLVTTLGGVGVLVTAFLALSYATVRQIIKDFGGIPQIGYIHAEAPVTAPTPPQPPTARVVSDEELAAVASAQPKIKLEAMSLPVEVVDVQVDEATATDDATDVKQDHPEWIDAHLGDNQKLIVSGPFTTKESCEADTQKQLASWIGGHYGDESNANYGTTLDVSLFIKSQHATKRDTSVGEMHFLYTLAEVTPEVEAQIAKSLAEAAAQVAKRRGVRAVSFAGAGVLSLVALTHIMLRSGGRKATNKPTH